MPRWLAVEHYYHLLSVEMNNWVENGKLSAFGFENQGKISHFLDCHKAIEREFSTSQKTKQERRENFAYTQWLGGEIGMKESNENIIFIYKNKLKLNKIPSFILHVEYFFSKRIRNYNIKKIWSKTSHSQFHPHLKRESGKWRSFEQILIHWKPKGGEEKKWGESSFPPVIIRRHRRRRRLFFLLSLSSEFHNFTMKIKIQHSCRRKECCSPWLIAGCVVIVAEKCTFAFAFSAPPPSPTIVHNSDFFVPSRPT